LKWDIVWPIMMRTSAKKKADPQNGNHSQKACVGRFGTCPLRPLAPT